MRGSASMYARAFDRSPRPRQRLQESFTRTRLGANDIRTFAAVRQRSADRSNAVREALQRQGGRNAIQGEKAIFAAFSTNLGSNLPVERRLEPRNLVRAAC